MTARDDFDRTLADWLDAEAVSPIPLGGLDQALDATRRRSPRAAWLARVGGHWMGGPGSSARELHGRALQFAEVDRRELDLV